MQDIIFAAAGAVLTVAAAVAPATAASPKDIGVRAMTELFDNLDVTAVDRYFGPTYIQHNITAPDGAAALKELITALAGNPAFKRVPYRILSDGNLVAFHSTYESLGPEPLVAFDIFRVENGRIVEHWDGLSPVTPPNPSGHTQVDGPTEIADRDQTDSNRALVTDFIKTVLIAGAYDQLPRFIDADSYTQHNSNVADGLGGMAAAIEAMAKQGIRLEYRTLHRVVADGNFVLAQSEGAFGGTASAYYDLFRVANGRIVEHWDVIQPIPTGDAVKNGNGMF